MTSLTPTPKAQKIFPFAKTKKKPSKENDVIVYNPIGEGNKMTDVQLDEMSQKAYDQGFTHGSNKKKKNNPFELGSRKRAYYNQGFAHGHAHGNAKSSAYQANKKHPNTVTVADKDTWKDKPKWISNHLRNEELNEALEEFDGSDEMLEALILEYGNSDDDDRAGDPTSPVPTTKTGILTQLSDWGLENKYVGAANRMDYVALKALVGSGTPETVNDIFKAAVGNAANVTGVEVMDKDKEASGQIKEHVNAIFNGVDLNEETKTKITTVFEAAVSSMVTEQLASLEEEALEEIELRVEEVETELTEKMDKYLTYVAETWAEENKLSLENAIKSEIAESFMNGIRQVFENHYVDVPATKMDAFVEMSTKVDELKEHLDAVLKKNIELTNSLSESKKATILKSVSEGLALTEVEKLKTLTESVSYESDTDYKAKVSQIKESYFNKKILTEDDKADKGGKVLTEENSSKKGKSILDLIPNQPRI